MQEIEILKLNEINFKTNLKFEDIIEIAERYIKEQGEPYEIDTKNILYDTNSYVINEPVWYVDIISKKIKERWPDAYISLAISDREGRLAYVQNDHGIVVKKFQKLNYGIKTDNVTSSQRYNFAGYKK